ncbi:hypothetical protein [Cohaesibacter celericrescens]|uniref:Uncharacterized protein n=1 Tax=Cohaesibacter celericrescens TaxID=2067669 RepID=A0A2N5XPA1_9HYPH|nr:hypothetical protein [Cohaesibacter celericrescens]PLW76323.1 hypothetical protein C0081_15645 [Cohaesibacter celericrescens]
MLKVTGFISTKPLGPEFAVECILAVSLVSLRAREDRFSQQKQARPITEKQKALQKTVEQQRKKQLTRVTEAPMGRCIA